MTKRNTSTDTRTLEGIRYLLTVQNKFNRHYDRGILSPNTEVSCLRKNTSGYYEPCLAHIVEARPSGRVTVDLWTDRSQRVTVSLKAILWKTEPESGIECGLCGSHFPNHEKGCEAAAVCQWTEGEEVFSGEHQWESGKCATCGQQDRCRECGESAITDGIHTTLSPHSKLCIACLNIATRREDSVDFTAKTANRLARKGLL